MLFNYKVIDQAGKEFEGAIEAGNQDIAIGNLQRKGYVIISIASAEQKSLLTMNLAFFERVSNKEVVIMSRQIATLFEAQVSALRVFRLLGAEVQNPTLERVMNEIADDLQGGSTISGALSKHPKVFSPFYVNMVKAGEESGRLDETFQFLADYLDRTYEVTSKAQHALIYPAFVIFTFIAVMVLMLTLVIPRLSTIIEESGQDVPIYTKIVMGLSAAFTDYGMFVFGGLAIGGAALFYYVRTGVGRRTMDELRLAIPYVGDLYRKLYLSRIADNLSTMLTSGITIVRALEITASVVGNSIYEEALLESKEAVKNGASISNAFAQHDVFPGMLTQMIRVGEETGEMGKILKTLATFYQREVSTAVDTLVDLIEPIMIVMLGLGVGTLLAAVLMPIYNIATNIR